MEENNATGIARNEAGIEARVEETDTKIADAIDFSAFDLKNAGQRTLASPQGVFFVVPVDAERIGGYMTYKSERFRLWVWDENAEGTEILFHAGRRRYTFREEGAAREAAQYFEQRLGRKVTVLSSQQKGFLENY